MSAITARELRSRALEILSASHAEDSDVALERVRALVARLVDDLAVSRIAGERRAHPDPNPWARYEAFKRALYERGLPFDKFETLAREEAERLKR